MRSMRSMRGGFIFRNRGPSLYAGLEATVRRSRPRYIYSREQEDTLKCIIVETRADSVAVKLNGLGLILAANVHRDVFVTSLCTCLEKKKAQNQLF
jgi:hypothetical protein